MQERINCVPGIQASENGQEWRWLVPPEHEVWSEILCRWFGGATPEEAKAARKRAGGE